MDRRIGRAVRVPRYSRTLILGVLAGLFSLSILSLPLWGDWCAGGDRVAGWCCDQEFGLGLEIGASQSSVSFDTWNDGENTIEIELIWYPTSSDYDGCSEGFDFSPSSTTLAPGQRKTFTISIDRRYMNAGDHHLSLSLRTTDNMDSFRGGVSFEATADGEFAECCGPCGDTDEDPDGPGESDGTTRSTNNASGAQTSEALKTTGTHLKTVGQAIQVIGGQGGVGDGPLYELGGRISAGASAVTQAIDIGDRALRLKQIAANIQLCNNEVQKGRYYGEALENYFAIESDLIKLIGPTASIFWGSTAAASSGLLVPAYIFAGIGSVARAVMGTAVVHVECGLAMANLYKPSTMLEAAVQGAYCDYQLHGVTNHRELYTVDALVEVERQGFQFAWEPSSDLVPTRRMYCLKSAAKLDEASESLDLKFAFISMSAHEEADAFDTVDAHVFAIYRLGGQEYRTRIADFNLVDALGARINGQLYSGTVSFPWKGVYGNPSSIEIEYKQPASTDSGPFAVERHSL